MGFALTPGEAPLHFSRSKNVMHVEGVTRNTENGRIDVKASRSKKWRQP